MTMEPKDPMMPDEPTAPQEDWIAVRLDQMESRVAAGNRSRKLLTGAVVLLTLALGAVVLRGELAWTLTPTATRPAVEAESFVLTDSDGRERGTWSVDDGAARLLLFDREERPRARLTVLANGSPGFGVVDEAGRSRIVLGLLPDETGTLVFADPQGSTRVVLGFAPDKSGSLLFADRIGRTRAAIGLDGSGSASLMLGNEEYGDGEPVVEGDGASIGREDDGSPDQ